ncbi:hypothetical protein IAU60_004493 [Kwoniella sp. DSM 27419]
MMTPLDPLLSSIPRRLTDLETYQLPRLESCRGPLDLHRELTEELRADLEAVRYDLEVARELFESLPAGQQANDAERLHALETQYDSIKSAFRTTSLQSKRAITSSRGQSDTTYVDKRYELDEGRINGTAGGAVAADRQGQGKGQRPEARSAAEFGMGGDDELQTKTNEVTMALRRTTALMQTELERSVLSVQMLESSTQTLLSTSNLYDRYSSLLDTASALVKALEKADTMDRVLICAALLFFLLVVGFIVKRRVLDRTVGLVIGGVGRGVGWYLFGTGRLIMLAFGCGSAKGTGPTAKADPGALNMANEFEQASGMTDKPSYQPIGVDSAVHTQAAEVGQIGSDIGPGHIPYNAQKGQPKRDPVKGGKVDTIALPYEPPPARVEL